MLNTYNAESEPVLWNSLIFTNRAKYYGETHRNTFILLMCPVNTQQSESLAEMAFHTIYNSF